MLTHPVSYAKRAIVDNCLWGSRKTAQQLPRQCHTGDKVGEKSRFLPSLRELHCCGKRCCCGYNTADGLKIHPCCFSELSHKVLVRLAAAVCLWPKRWWSDPPGEVRPAISLTSRSCKRGFSISRPKSTSIAIRTVRSGPRVSSWQRSSGSGRTRRSTLYSVLVPNQLPERRCSSAGGAAKSSCVKKLLDARP